MSYKILFCFVHHYKILLRQTTFLGQNLLVAMGLREHELGMSNQFSGRVVIVTSVKGRYAFPANSAYHASKYGLETMADSLRLEMLKFGVKVSIVEPGDFCTATACQNPDHVSY